MQGASEAGIAAVTDIIRMEFQHWQSRLPVMLHIWRDASDMNGLFAGLAFSVLTRKLSFAVDMQSLLKAWLDNGKGHRESLQELLAIAPTIIAGLREAAGLAEQRFRRHLRQRRCPVNPKEGITDVMLEKELLSETLEELEDKRDELAEDARMGDLTDEGLEEFELEVEEAKEWHWEIGVKVKRLKKVAPSNSLVTEYLPVLEVAIRGERKALLELGEAIYDLRGQTRESQAMLEVKKELERLPLRRGSREPAFGVS